MAHRYASRLSLALWPALIASLPAPVASQDAMAGNAIATFEAQVASDVEADGVGSIAAAVVIGRDVVWARGFGLADRDRRVEADDSTIYRIGSISKSVTAVVLMRLAEQGTVSLDDPVVKHLPEFARLGDGVPEATTITLRQLASHTGGLIREPGLENAAAGPIAQWEDKIIASIPTTTLRSQPGTAYSYSNIGYGILGLTLSRAAGEPFMGLVRHLFFEPLAMTSSTFIIRPPLDRHLATGYDVDRDGNVSGERAAREHAGRGYKVPNGGIYSTVHDLARFVALMTGALGDDVLSAESRTAMISRQTPPDGTGYGFGFFISTDDDGNRFVYHSGSVAGYNAMMFFHPETQIGVVLLRNYGRGATNLRAVSQKLLAALVAERPGG